MRILPEGTGSAFAKFFARYFGFALAIFILAFVASYFTLPLHYHQPPLQHVVTALLLAAGVDALVAFVAVIVGMAKSLSGLS